MTGKRRGIDLETGIEVTQAEMDAFYRPWVVNVDVRFRVHIHVDVDIDVDIEVVIKAET